MDQGAAVAERAALVRRVAELHTERMEELADLIEQGVVDPVKVTRSAVQNAVSIAGLLLTTEALITDIPEEKSAPPMPGGGGVTVGGAF